MLPENLLYTKEHEWIKKDGAVITIGITDYAQEELGDITFVELPEPGAALSAGDSPVTIESVKAVSSVYAPSAGKVTEVNGDLEDQPELINESPFESGWIYRMQLDDESLAGLMSAEEYQEYIDGLD